MVLAIADVFAFELPVLVDDVVETVDVRVGAETEEDVARHLVYADAPLDGGKTVSVDRVQNVEVEEVQLVLLLVERRLYQSGRGKREMRGESCVVGDP